jgi:ABC-2 type transport system ATP-binding protein
VERVCSRVGILKDGRLVAAGELQSLLQTALEVEIEIDRVDEGLLAALRPLVRDLRREGTSIIARVAEREDLPRLARAVVERGLALYALRPRSNSLEDVFLDLVAGGEDHG